MSSPEQDPAEPAEEVIPDREVLRRSGHATSQQMAVLVAGWEGAGKTMLSQQWETKHRGEQRKTRMSLVVEDRDIIIRPITRSWWQMRTRSKNITVAVVPGQIANEPRRAILNQLGPGRSPRGSIYVVCWGYNEPWLEGESEVIHAARRRAAVASFLRLEKPTPADCLHQLRALHLEREIDDFEEISNVLARTWATSDGVQSERHWLVIAMTKCDLYESQIDQAREYYSGGDGQFGRLLDKLSRRVPGLEIRVLPVSSGPQTYGEKLGLGVVVVPQLDGVQTRKRLDYFWTAVEGLCGYE